MSSGSVVRAVFRQWQPCRSLLNPRISPFTLRGPHRIQPQASFDLQCRFYASKNKKGGNGKGRDDDTNTDSGRRSRGKNTSEAATPENTGRRGTGTSDALVPGSERVSAGEAHAAADTRMRTATDWLKRSAAQLEQQGAGRVTPDVLRPVRVTMPDGSSNALVEVATVGVKDGTTLIVTVFAEETLKHVEKAIYTAKIPHVVPQRVDSRMIKIPMPKPTVSAREELAKEAAKLAEDTRVQLRRISQTSIKKGGYAKHSVEIDEFQDLLQKHLKEVDKIVADIRKNLGVK